ncbi:MAG TPA: amidohydrolase family protein [Candidatus Acidoferrales bacterium]|nr:amidohydrolase family protein [Candidatus Acidoferrales bacterium]
MRVGERIDLLRVRRFTTRCTLLFLIGAVAACHRPQVASVLTPAPRRVVLRHVAVLDVAAGERITDRDVLVEDEQIRAVVKSGALPPLRDAQEIDGAGATLLPGLIDLHAHTGINPAPPSLNAFPDPAANLAAYLYCGVTTVVDLGGLAPDVIERRDRVAAGKLLGPTLYVAGPVLTVRGGHPVHVLQMMLPFWLRWYAIPRYVVQVDDAPQAAAAAERIADMHVDFLKVIVDRIPREAPRLDTQELTAAVTAARGRGLRALAHIGTTQDAIDAAQAGVAAWAHVVYRERIADEQIATLAAFKIPMVPTIVGFEALASAGQKGRQATRLERETVPSAVLAAFDEPARDPEAAAFAEDSARFLQTQRQNWRDNVRRLHAAGVVMLAGSDMQTGVFPGAGLHRELGYLKEAGLSEIEVIRAATIDAARFLEAKDDPDFGIVAPGKRADLLLVDGNPLDDLGNLDHIRAVMVRGMPVERVALTN